MTLAEFYDAIGGDLAEVKSRLLTEERILKYLRKLPYSGDYEGLKASLEECKYEDAFRFSHTLKGLCLNLGVANLYKPSSALCENLRGGTPKQDCAPFMADVDFTFLETKKLIGEIE